MRSVIAAFLAIGFLGGCAAPLLVAGSFASVEVVSDAARPNLMHNGSSLFKAADWKNAEDRTTYSIKGKSSWKCAVTKDGGHLCVNSDQMAEINSRSQLRFQCQIGYGGMFTAMMDKRSNTSLFCERG